jgi:Tol biopolymer transport system component
MSRTTSLLLAALTLALIGPATASATFPGTNGKIAFVGAGSSGQCSGPSCVPSNSLYTVNADGSGLKALTSGGLGAQSPGWSPSGKLAYVLDGTVYVRSASLGRAKAAKLKGVRPRSADNLAWASDGSRFYLRATASSGGTMAFMLAGGTLPTARVLLQGTDVQDVSASPNGKQIAFVNNGSLSVAGANGKNVTSLVSGVSSVDWSPDSTRLVTSINGAIWTMSATGGSRTQVTQPPSAATGWESAAMPTFSPDGTSIVFLLMGANPDPTPAEVQAAESTHGLATIPVAGGTPTLVVPDATVSPNFADQPVMQPLG